MINRFTVEGRLTKDIELKKTTNGTFVSEFDIACTRNRRNESGEYDSDFFRCKAFSKLAEIAKKYGQKGRRVLVDGRLQPKPEAQPAPNPYKEYQTPPQPQDMKYGELYDGITDEDMPW